VPRICSELEQWLSMAVWIVVGGASNGGILVRAGQDLASAQKSDRLGTGSRVRQQALIGERLHYELLQGTGPSSGWVSTKLKDKDLLIKQENEAHSDSLEGAAQVQEETPQADSQQLQQRCEACGIELERLEWGEEAARRLLEQVDRLEGMSASAIKTEIKRRGFAYPAGGQALEHAVRLRDIIVWEEFRLAELRRECSRLALPVEGNESHADCMQLISNATWELRGVPVWRLPSTLVGYGVLDQIDSFATRSVEDLAAQCRKRGIPVEETEAPLDKETLVQRLSLAIIWKVLPMHELRRECQISGIPMDDLGLQEECELVHAAAHRRWSDSVREQDVRPVLLRRLVEHMCGAAPVQPGTDSNATKGHQPHQDEQSKEQRISDVQEVSTAAAAMKDYMKAVGGTQFWTGRPESGNGPAALPKRAAAAQLQPQQPPATPLPLGPVLPGSAPSRMRTVRIEPHQAVRGLGRQRAQGQIVGVQGLGGRRPQKSPAEVQAGNTVLRNGTTILLARHGERLDDYEAFRGRAWVPTAETPWDPPLTDVGRKQAAALGNAAMEHLKRLKLPPLTRVFSSPYVRCFGTAVEVALEVGLQSVSVEPSLSESFCENFYRSWCVPYANGNWGGPDGFGIGVPVADEKIRPEARAPASELLPADRLDRDLPEAVVKADASYSPHLPLSDVKYQWGDFETEEQLSARMRSFFDYVACVYPGETVMLISHGGPLQALLSSVMPGQPSPMPFYCALYLLHQRHGGDGSWKAPLIADTEHMQQWASRYAAAGRPKATGKRTTIRLSAAMRNSRGKQ